MTDQVWSGERENPTIGHWTPSAARPSGSGGRPGSTPPPDGIAAATSTRRRWHAAYRRWAVTADALAGVAAATVGALVAVRDPEMGEVLALVLLVAASWVTALSLCHGYEKRFVGTTAEEYRAVFHAAVGLFCVVAFVSYAAQLTLARDTVLVVLPALLLFGLLGRRTLRKALYRRRMRGQDVENTVVIGNVQTVGRLIREIRRAPSQGMHIVAACVSGLDTSGDGLSSVEGVPVFGYPAQAMSTVDLFDAEVVAVSAHLDMEEKALRRLAWALEERGVDLVVAPGIVEVAGPRLSIRPVAGVSLLHVERPVMSGARRLVKAVADRTLAVLLFL